MVWREPGSGDCICCGKVVKWTDRYLARLVVLKPNVPNSRETAKMLDCHIRTRPLILNNHIRTTNTNTPITTRRTKQQQITTTTTTTISTATTTACAFIPAMTIYDRFKTVQKRSSWSTNPSKPKKRPRPRPRRTGEGARQGECSKRPSRLVRRKRSARTS